MTFADPITAGDLAPALYALDTLDGDATELRGCADFERWCDERRSRGSYFLRRAARRTS